MKALGEKVLIIDDRYDEVEPLISFLNEKGIATIFNDSMGDIGKLSGVRCIFSDISLIAGPVIVKNSASMIAGIITDALSLDNGPYVLFFWSANTDSHLDDLKEHLINYLPKELCPIAIEGISKSCFFETIVCEPLSAIEKLYGLKSDQIEKICELLGVDKGLLNRKFRIKDEGVSQLEEILNTIYKNLPAYGIIRDWENNILKTKDITLAKLNRIISDDNKNVESNNLEKILFRLAIGNGGIRLQNELESEESTDLYKTKLLLKSIQETLSQTFTNNNSRTEITLDCTPYDGLIQNNRQVEIQLTESLKYMFHMNSDNDIEIITETTVKCSAENCKKASKGLTREHKKNILEAIKNKMGIAVIDGRNIEVKDSLFCIGKLSSEFLPILKFVGWYLSETIVSSINSHLLIGEGAVRRQAKSGDVVLCTDVNEELLRSLLDFSDLNNKDDDKEIKMKQRIADMKSRVFQVSIELSPDCDYSQEKRKFLRKVYGLAVKIEDDYLFIKDKGDSVIHSPTLLIENSASKLILDLKFFVTKDIITEDISFALHNSFVDSLKGKMAYHVSRTGYVNI